MSKGYGIGHANSTAGFARRTISAIGGIVKGAGHLRSGLRAESTAHAAGLCSEARTLGEKNAVSVAREPVRMSMWKQGGKWRVSLEDGRRRALAAKGAGATRIRATVTVRRPGQRAIAATTIVRL
jgi:hypothetical protein